MDTMSTPLTDDEREQIADLLHAGKSRAEIAKTVGRSVGTVANVAKAIGWTGDQSAALRTRRAQENRSAYSMEKRAELAAKATVRAEEMLAKMEGAYLVFNFGGKDNTYEEHTLSSPPTEAQRAMAQTFRDLMRTVLDIKRADEATDRDQGKSMIERLVEGLEAVAS